MNQSPCNSPDCPVPAPGPYVRAFRSRTIPVGGTWWRATKVHREPTELVPGHGNTRFAPIPDVAHLYLAATRTTAVVESVLHDSSIPERALDQWRLTPVTLRSDVRVVDWRNPELERMGLERGNLISTTPQHYPCTRRWANAAKGIHRGGDPIAGAIWHSRQAELLAAANPGGVFDDVATGDVVEALVLWSPPAANKPVSRAGPDEPLAGPSPFAIQVCDILGIEPII